MIEPLASLVLSVGNWMVTPDNIGFIVLAIILTPVLTITTIALFSPLQGRIPGLFLSSVVVLTGFVLLSFALFGALLKFIVPQ